MLQKNKGKLSSIIATYERHLRGETRFRDETAGCWLQIAIGVFLLLLLIESVQKRYSHTDNILITLQKKDGCV